ncbi:unnamed protein product [Linum trigynum]|uniref:Uncharacterized protein n=1 Tax=Linum trigynum TaxID=586398 RepID=A0AAV2D8I0_9ROSI
MVSEQVQSWKPFEDAVNRFMAKLQENADRYVLWLREHELASTCNAFPTTALAPTPSTGIERGIQVNKPLPGAASAKAQPAVEELVVQPTAKKPSPQEVEEPSTEETAAADAPIFGAAESQPVVAGELEITITDNIAISTTTPSLRPGIATTKAAASGSEGAVVEVGKEDHYCCCLLALLL